MGAETITSALRGVVANKLRSSLTILGLTIGVASVIVLIAVGNGSSHAVQQRIEALGSNVLLVTRGFNLGGSGSSGVASQPLTQADASALNHNDQAPDVLDSSPVVNASPTLVNGSVSYQPSSFVGTTPGYEQARDYRVAEGSFFTNKDVQKRGRVVVIGPTVASNLFPGQNPVGQTIQVGGTQYQVIGVTQSKGSNGVQDQDDVAFAPITAVQDTLTGYGDIDQIVVQAKSRSALDDAESEVTSVLDQRHKISDSADADFRVINQGSILQASSSTSSSTTSASVAA